jgi:HK97 gp10 family phage protein
MEYTNAEKVIQEFSEYLALLSAENLNNNGNVRTGALLRSIEPLKGLPDNRIGVKMKDYGIFIENGTKYFSAKPFVKPAMADVQAQYKQALEEAVRKDIEAEIDNIINSNTQ